MRRSFVTAAAAFVYTFALLGGMNEARAQTQIAQSGQTITTGDAGKQVLFPDKTSISLGANSKVTVRRVDYDRQSGKANVVIEVAKGAVRYITGNSEGSHTIKTPLSTVGVRGTVIEGYVDGNGNEVFALFEGAFEVCTATAGCQQVTVPGTFVIVSPAGVVSPPTPIPPSMMSALLLASPSLDLVREHFSDRINNGSDPLVTFRDLNDAHLNSPVAQPGALPGCRRDFDCDGDIDDPKHPHPE